MKIIKYIVILLIISFILSENVSAASGSLSVSSASLYENDNFTVIVNINSSAAWNVHVSATGPVSGCSINQADATGDALDTNKSFSATCTATGVGTITLTLTGDVTSSNDGIAVPLSGSKSVTVSKRPSPKPSPQPQPQPKPNVNPKPNPNTPKLSTNNKLKSISVDGYNLEKKDNNNYKLTVNSYVKDINIAATAEDSKAKLSGTGKKDLKVGENKFEIVVTSESGSQNKINIIVNKTEYASYSDLDKLLKEKDLNDIDILMNKNKITIEDLNKIKLNNKTINFVFKDEQEKVVYSWIIDGNKLNREKEIITDITFASENESIISELSNYAEGKIVNIKHSGELPDGTKIRIYVGDKYSGKKGLNLYYYDETKKILELIKTNIICEDGYVEFELDHASEYFLTQSKISKNVETKCENSNDSTIFIIIIAVEFIILIIVLICVLSKKNRKNKIEKNNIINNDIINTNNGEYNNISNTQITENINNSLNKDVQTNSDNGVNDIFK